MYKFILDLLMFAGVGGGEEDTETWQWRQRQGKRGERKKNIFESRETT